MNEAKKYTIDILDDQYTIFSDESREHIDKVTVYVNALLHDIRLHDAYIDHKKAVVLTALRIASDAMHAEDAVATMQERAQKLFHMMDTYLCNSGQ